MIRLPQRKTARLEQENRNLRENMELEFRRANHHAERARRAEAERDDLYQMVRQVQAAVQPFPRAYPWGVEAVAGLTHVDRR